MALLLMVPSPSGANPVVDPTAYVWTSRVLLVFAPSNSNPALAVQRAALAANGAGLRERDLVVLTSVAGDASDDTALRRKYGAPATGFAALLIGKDGGVKLRSAEPITPLQLFQTVDAMPMRRSEVRGRQ